jgi:hypothetical protein
VGPEYPIPPHWPYCATDPLEGTEVVVVVAVEVEDDAVEVGAVVELWIFLARGEMADKPG